MRVLGLFLLAVGLTLGLIGLIGTILALGKIQNWGAAPFLALLTLAFIGAGLLVIAVLILRNSKPIGAVPTPVDGKVGGYIPNVSSTFELDGSPYTVLYSPPVKGKNGRPSSLIIHTPVKTKGEFQIVVETWFDKFCKRVGLATEIQTGDEAFDKQCYIRTDMEEFTKAYLTDPLKRVAIVDLRRFGFNTVSVDDGDVSVMWTGFDPLKHDQPHLVEEVAARLILLARNLPPHQPEFDHRTGQHRKLWQGICWSFLVVFALTMLS